MKRKKTSMIDHPCLSSRFSKEPGLLLLPSDAGCNLGCVFCPVKGDEAVPAGPHAGIYHRRPDRAVDRVAALMGEDRPPERVEIAGPGEPLLDAATPVMLRQLRWIYPELKRSVRTNGLLLPDRLDELVDAGAQSLVISINAILPRTAEHLYNWIVYRGRWYAGRDAAELLLRQQWSGIANAAAAGLSVSISSLIIPRVNEDDIPLIERRARDMGADHVQVARLPV